MSDDTAIAAIVSDVKEMRADIKFILERLAEDKRKYLTCKQMFDEIYINRKEFKSILHDEIRHLREGKYKTTGYIRDIVQIAQTIAILLLATGIIP
jgi:hypothetical protein